MLALLSCLATAGSAMQARRRRCMVVLAISTAVTAVPSRAPSSIDTHTNALTNMYRAPARIEADARSMKHSDPQLFYVKWDGVGGVEAEAKGTYVVGRGEVQPDDASLIARAVSSRASMAVSGWSQFAVSASTHLGQSSTQDLLRAWYAAGLLEGYATADEIATYALNAKYSMFEQKYPSDDHLDFLERNLQWVDSRISSYADTLQSNPPPAAAAATATAHKDPSPSSPTTNDSSSSNNDNTDTTPTTTPTRAPTPHVANTTAPSPHEGGHYWLAVAAAVAQFDGLVDGYAMSHASHTLPLSALDLYVLNSYGDNFDLVVKFPSAVDRPARLGPHMDYAYARQLQDTHLNQSANHTEQWQWVTSAYAEPITQKYVNSSASMGGSQQDAWQGMVEAVGGSGGDKGDAVSMYGSRGSVDGDSVRGVGGAAAATTTTTTTSAGGRDGDKINGGTITPAPQRPRRSTNTNNTLHQDRCSVLIKLLLTNGGPAEGLSTNQTTASPTNGNISTNHVPPLRVEDVLVTHTTFDSYVAVLPRTIRSVSLPAFIGDSAAPVMVEAAFSASPGQLASLDDFYIVRSTDGTKRLFITETTLELRNETLLQDIVPEGLLYWMRVTVANMWSRTGGDWTKLYARGSVGTYNDEWMVVDLSTLSRDGTTPEGLLLVLNQAPGLVKVHDKTQQLLESGYFASYNIPMDTDVYDRLGYAQPNLNLDLTDGVFDDYDTSPRAQLFKNAQAQVKTVDDMKRVGQLNRWDQEPVCRNHASLAIAARGDLEVRGPFGNPLFSANGGIDGKVVSLRDSNIMADLKLTTAANSNDKSTTTTTAAVNPPPALAFHARVGPTTDDQPQFCWTAPEFGHMVRLGHPDCINYQWQTFAPAELLSNRQPPSSPASTAQPLPSTTLTTAAVSSDAASSAPDTGRNLRAVGGPCAV